MCVRKVSSLDSVIRILVVSSSHSYYDTLLYNPGGQLGISIKMFCHDNLYGYIRQIVLLRSKTNCLIYPYKLSKQNILMDIPSWPPVPFGFMTECRNKSQV